MRIIPTSEQAQPLTRSKAKAAGARFYFTGKACRHGHESTRYASSGQCFECVRTRAIEKQNEIAAYKKQYQKDNAFKISETKKKRAHGPQRESILQAQRDHYRKNSLLICEQQRLDYKKDPRSKQQSNSKSYQKNRKAHTDRCRLWVKSNPGKSREHKNKWKSKNQSSVTAGTAKRRASKMKRTPPWLSKSQMLEIRHVYKSARLLSIQTGVAHHVDHIIPLQGELVSGLHVPWNLQVLTAFDNASKGNTYTP